MAGCSSNPNTESLLSAALEPVGLAEDRHRMSHGTLQSIREPDVAGAARPKHAPGLGAIDRAHQRRADRLRALVVLGAHAVGARDAAAGVLDGANVHAGDELEEPDRLLRDSLRVGVAGVVVDDAQRHLAEPGVELP